MATHTSILAWRIPWTEEPGGHSPQGYKESDTAERLPLALSGIIKHRLPSVGQRPGSGLWSAALAYRNITNKQGPDLPTTRPGLFPVAQIWTQPEALHFTVGDYRSFSYLP